MRLKKRWVAGVVSVLVMVGAMQAASIRPSVVRGQAGDENSDAPYLYYFSNDLNAWVIERADGTNRRLLGQGLMTKDPDSYSISVDGPGWSPSGKWFAWNAAPVRAGPGFINNFQGFLVSTDGTQKSGLLGDMKNVQMAWSPTEDLLLVSAYYAVQGTYPDESNPASYDGEFVFKLRLLEPTNPSPVAEFERHIPIDWSKNRPPSAPTLKWIRGGSYAIVETHSNEGEAYLDNLNASEFFIVDRNGTYTTREFDNVIYAAAYENLIFTQDSMPVSELGNILVWDDGNYRLENLLTGISQTLGNLMPYDRFKPRMIWSTDGQWGLLAGEAAFFIIIQEDSVRIEPIPPDIEFVLLSERNFSNYYDSPKPRQWSPTNDYFMFQAMGGRIYYFDLAGQHITLLMEGVSEDGAFGQWLDENHVLVAKDYDQTFSEQEFYLYDLRDTSSPQEIFVVEDTSGYRYATLSPNGQYMAYMLDGPVIYDRESEQTQYIRPDADSYFSIGGGETRWSDDSQWLLIFDNALVAGGGGMQHLGIVRADGQFRRDLSFAPFPSLIALDWLPAQVDRDDLPDPIIPMEEPTPIQYLEGQDWIYALSWSPDGQQVAGYLWGGKLRTWNLETGESTLQTGMGHVEATNGWRISWEQVESNYQALIIQDPQLQNTDYAYPIAFSPDGRIVIHLNEEWKDVASDVATGEELALLSSNVNSVSFSPDGSYLAVGHPYQPAVIWDTRTWQIVYTLQHPSLAVAFSPDGEYLAVGVSWDVEIWRVSDLIGAEN